MKQKLFGKLSILLIALFILTATAKLSANSSIDTIPIKALKNALIVADSLDRCKQEIAAFKRLDSISDVIIDTLIKAIKIKDKQLQISKEIYKDCSKLNDLIAAKNEGNIKGRKRELFWKRFFQVTTVAALTIAAIK